MSTSPSVKKVMHAMNVFALVAFFVIYSSDAFAQGQRRGGQRNQGGYGQPGVQVVKAKLYGKVVHGPTFLPIKRIIKQHNYGVQLQGKQLKAVIVKAKKLNYYGKGAVQLIINGYPEGRPVRLSEYGEKLILPVYGQATIGRHIQTIKLKVIGRVQVQMIGMKLKQKMPTHRCGRGQRGCRPRPRSGRGQTRR